jgi:hypothetical protein
MRRPHRASLPEAAIFYASAAWTKSAIESASTGYLPAQVLRQSRDIPDCCNSGAAFGHWNAACNSAHICRREENPSGAGRNHRVFAYPQFSSLT